MKPAGLSLGLSVALLALLIVVTSCVFVPVLGHDYVFDDLYYIQQNTHIQEGLTTPGIKWAFTTFYQWNWHPVTWMSHMLDVNLFGLAPRGPHAVNLAIHLINVVLLWLLLAAATSAPWPCASVAFLFAIHPLHVESVAWVSERKDVLSTLFLFLTMGAWLLYVRRPSPPKYLLAVLCFALGLMCKPMLVTGPFLLLLLDYWPLGRLFPRGGSSAVRRALMEKLPLLVLSAASGTLTFLAQQRGGSVVSWEHYPLTLRLGSAALSFLGYLWKTVWPQGLSAFYPFRTHAAWAWEVAGALIALALVTLASFSRRRRYPYLMFGWLWYLVALLPVIGLIQVGSQSMADRYTYIPLIGPFVAAAWGLAEIAGTSTGWKASIAAATALAIVALAVAAGFQVRVWKDNLTLFSHARDVAPDNWVAEYYLGLEMNRLGQRDQAIHHYQRLVKLAPNSIDGHDGLGVLLAQEKRLSEASLQFLEALRLDPRYAPAHGNLGLVLAREGKLQEAVASYRRALELDSGLAWVHNNLAAALRSQGKTQEASAHYAKALELDPANRQAHSNLGMILYEQGHMEEAARHFKAAAGQ